jgi:hypothetical protein
VRRFIVRVVSDYWCDRLGCGRRRRGLNTYSVCIVARAVG